MSSGARETSAGELQRRRPAQRWRTPLWASCRACLRLLSLLLTAARAASQPASCQDAALRPVLGEIRPSRIPWRGGVITVTGAAFLPRIDVSVGSVARQCTVLFVNRSVLTCLAPPSEYAAAGVSARIDNCESAQVLLLEYVGWPWQNAWRWQTLSCQAGNNGAVRLVGCTSVACRLEVQYQQQWGTVCDDSFSDADAAVACRSLGLPTAGAVQRQSFGGGSGPIWMDEVNCTGSELDITQCPRAVRPGLPWGSHNCDHSQDVGVCCGEKRPSQRIGHTLSADGDGNLVLYGGLADAGVLGDVWVLKKLPGQQRDGDEMWVWSARQPRGDAPPRTEHVAGVLDGCLYIFGGWNAQTAPASSSAALDGEVTTGREVNTTLVKAKFEANTYALNLSASASGSNPLAWERVESGNVQPQPRRGACSAASDKLGLLMYGGHDSLSRQVRLVDTHLYRLAPPRQKFSKSQCTSTFVL